MGGRRGGDRWGEGKQPRGTGGDEVRQRGEPRPQGVKDSDLILLGHNVHPNTPPPVDGPQFLHLENEGLDFIIKISPDAHTFILLEIKVGLLLVHETRAVAACPVTRGQTGTKMAA